MFGLDLLPLVPLLENFAFLTCASALLFLFVSRTDMMSWSAWRKIFFGLVLGTVSVIVVTLPVPGPLGASFDTRAAPIVLAGYFGGPIGGLIAALIGAAARYHVGGPAVIGGMASFFLYAAAGFVWSGLMRARNVDRLDIRSLVFLALFATVCVLPSFFIGQSFETGLTILQRFWAVLLLGNVAGTVCLGLMIEYAFKVVRERDQHRIDAESFKVAKGAAEIGVWSLDFRNGALTWDEMTHRVMGRSASAFEPTLSSFLGLLLDEDRKQVERAFEAARRTSSRFSADFRVRDESGAIRFVRGQASFVGGVPGDPAVAIGVAIDRTREQELLDDLALTNLAVENAVCGIIIAEAAGDMHIVSVNRAFTELTGYRPEEVIGRNCRFLNDGLSGQPELMVLRRALSTGGRCSVRLRNRRKDGSQFWNNLHVAPITNRVGAVTHFIGIQEDVSEQIEARMAAESARDELNAVVMTVADAIITVDQDQNITSLNEAAERMFGWSRGALVGQNIRLLVPEAHHEKHKRLANDYLADASSVPGPMTDARVVDGRKQDGSVFPVMVSLGRFLHDGKPAVAVTAHDMTEMMSVNRSLTELSDQLSAQLSVAEEANRSKNRFLAHMSHELRTPLNAIIGFSDMIRMSDEAAFSSEKIREYAGDINKSGQHLLSLINDVLDISRIEHDAFPIDLAPLLPGPVVASAIEALTPIAGTKGVWIELDDRSRGSVLADRRAFYQCLLNILSNAVKFSPMGALILVEISERGGLVEFKVTDHGVGMSDATRERIGHPFLRSDDPDTSSREGTGLGLAITKELAEKQNGSLEVVSVLALGTVVTICLPRWDGESAERPESHDSLLPESGSRNAEVQDAMSS